MPPFPVPDQSARLRVEVLEDRSVPAVLDLTASGATGGFNGTLFAQFDGRTAPRWSVDTFLHLHASHSTAQGFNTSAPRKSFDVAGKTHAVKVADLPSVTVNGVTYRELVLDVSQPRHSPKVSLDELKLYVSNNPKLTGYRASAGTLGGLAPVYDLDSDANNRVMLDARLNGSNGRGDALVYIPDALLAGGKYLSLYSKFGANSSAQCGEVSWGYGRCGPLGQPPVPPAPQTGGVSGVVFQDYNADGVRDADEPLVAGRVVWADANSNGQVDPGEASTTTAADGSYTLTGLTAGTQVAIRSFADDGYAISGVLVTPQPDEILLGVDIGVFVSTPF